MVEYWQRQWRQDPDPDISLGPVVVSDTAGHAIYCANPTLLRVRKFKRNQHVHIKQTRILAYLVHLGRAISLSKARFHHLLHGLMR